MDRRGFIGFFLWGGLLSFFRRSTAWRAVRPERPLRRAMFWRPAPGAGGGQSDA